MHESLELKKKACTFTERGRVDVCWSTCSHELEYRLLAVAARVSNGRAVAFVSQMSYTQSRVRLCHPIAHAIGCQEQRNGRSIAVVSHENH